jgi:biopolymer transport protein TolQ
LRTLGSSFLALFLQAAEAGTPASPVAPRAGGAGFLDLLAGSSYVARAVLLVLGVLSIVSWAIIFYKLWTFGRAERQSKSFLDIFRRSNKFSEVQAVCHSLEQSPLVGLFQSGYSELTAQLRQAPSAVPNGTPNPAAPAARPTLKSIAAVDRALLRASGVEVNKLEHRISFLATTASIAPFVGLFGTVWGIMIAFLGISQTGSTNLGAVGPGIAEALITTAMGLATAVPAVVAYNYFSQRVKIFASAMDDFAMEFLNIAERNFT